MSVVPGRYQVNGRVTFRRSPNQGSKTISNFVETFVDLGANVGAYTLTIAKNHENKGVKVIAIAESYKALSRNIQINSFTNVKKINKAVSDHNGIISLNELSHDGHYSYNVTHRIIC